MQFKQQKITGLEKKLLNKIKQLNHEITTLPAYLRRKKDKANREVFRTALIILGLTGIVIFGVGWLAVALLGTALSIIIVESGLYLSAIVGLSGGPLYGAYLWIRDFFAPEKIKIQNKNYANVQKNLIELRDLYCVKAVVSKKIENLFSQIKFLGISQCDLNVTLHYLESIQKKHPAYSRRQKDTENWEKIIIYSSLASVVAVSLLTVSVAICVGIIVLPLPYLMITIIGSTLIFSLLGPLTVNCVLHASYLGIRNLFSDDKTKAENQEYNQLKKIIDELKKLSQEQDKLDQLIEGKLQESDTHKVSTKETNAKILSKASSEKNLALNDSKNNYGPLFPVPVIDEDKEAPSISMRFSNSM